VRSKAVTRQAFNIGLTKASKGSVGPSRYRQRADKLDIDFHFKIGLGYDRTDRKYLVFAETTGYSLGIATAMPDDSAGPSNVNNSGPSYTSSPVNLWAGSNPAHRLMHTLGAVNASAPHGTGQGHCWDEYDRMCYKISHALNGNLVPTGLDQRAFQFVGQTVDALQKQQPAFGHTGNTLGGSAAFDRFAFGDGRGFGLGGVGRP
jgi:hypothetical protein